jgi:DNA polymerase-3 subunit delta'
MLALADALGADRDAAEARFARALIFDRLAAEVREAAMAGLEAQSRLASASELWDKAQALFDDADSLNLDFRQTLVAAFDAIRKHFSPPVEPR